MHVVQTGDHEAEIKHASTITRAVGGWRTFWVNLRHTLRVASLMVAENMSTCFSLGVALKIF